MQYRGDIEAEESNALTEALELKADGAEVMLDGGTATLVGWTQVNAGAALADGETEIEISLPWGNDDAAGQVANLNVVVEAVQANADLAEEIVIEATGDAEANGQKLTEVLAGITEETNVVLGAGEYKLPQALEIPNGVSLYGAQRGNAAADWVNDDGAEKTVIVAPDSGDRVIKVEQGEGETISDVVIDGILVECGEKDVKGIFIRKTAGEAMTGIAVLNSAVVN